MTSLFAAEHSFSNLSQALQNLFSVLRVHKDKQGTGYFNTDTEEKTLDFELFSNMCGFLPKLSSEIVQNMSSTSKFLLTHEIIKQLSDDLGEINSAYLSLDNSNQYSEFFVIMSEWYKKVSEPAFRLCAQEMQDSIPRQQPTIMAPL